jgi:hypothetical protein
VVVRTEGTKRKPSRRNETSAELPRWRPRSRDVEAVEPPESLDGVMRRHVQWVVERSRTFREAAQRLGIDLATLWRMRKRWGLD